MITGCKWLADCGEIDCGEGEIICSENVYYNESLLEVGNEITLFGKKLNVAEIGKQTVVGSNVFSVIGTSGSGKIHIAEYHRRCCLKYITGKSALFLQDFGFMLDITYKRRKIYGRYF